MDCLRTVAILLVILAHTILGFGSPALLAPLQLGGTGVDLFFVLSGWLLGGQLFREAQSFGKINIGRFWGRRWLRTFPAYFAVLLFTVAQQYVTKDNFQFPLEYLFFLQNYIGSLDILYISWSLSVEEQFYLAIAPLVALLTWYSRSKATLICLIVLLLLPSVFRYFEMYAQSIETHVRLDGCVAGVLLAYIQTTYKHIWQRLCCIAPLLATVGLGIYIFYYVSRYFPEWSIGEPSKLGLAIIFSSWILLANSTLRWQHFLYFPGCYYVATRSYSMYLLHPDAIALVKKLPIDLPFALFAFLVMLITIVASELLYRLVERTFMRLRDR